jgi:methyltransferase (TIGR00027 family)
MGDDGSSTVDNFTNDSAMMIAFERALETKRADALFSDPLAEALAGSKGESLSGNFENMCTIFEFEGWREFHKTWVAVRTRFIDDRVVEHAAGGGFAQLVNLGAGMDTRPYRLESYQAFPNGAFDVDMAVVNEGRAKIFTELLANQLPALHCAVTTVDLDFLDEERSLQTELSKEGSRFDPAAPSLFVSEGLIMYLGAAGKLKLIADVSAVAAPGSVLVLQYMDASQSAAAKEHPGALDNALSVEEAARELTTHGWLELQFSMFGDEKLNFGRYPTEKFQPSASFSFCVCKKGPSTVDRRAL